LARLPSHKCVQYLIFGLATVHLDSTVASGEFFSPLLNFAAHAFETQEESRAKPLSLLSLLPSLDASISLQKRASVRKALLRHFEIN